MNGAKWTALLVAAAIIGLGGTAWADSPSLSGTWELDREASDEMVEAFEPAIDEMSRFKRGFARRAVRDADDPSPKRRINLGDEVVKLQSLGGPIVELPLDGEEVTYEDRDGDTVTSSAGLDGGMLVVDNDIEEGEYTSEYHLSDDGDRLEIVMEMDMDELPKKVDYRLVYDRE